MKVIPRHRQAFDIPVSVPGSKSLSNRAIVMAALAEGRSVLQGALRSDDTDGLLKSLNDLGVKSIYEGEELAIIGCSGRLPYGGEVHLGHGGTPSRFMMAVAMLASEAVGIDGSARMRERPIGQLSDFLSQMGCGIEFKSASDHLPLVITPPSPRDVISRLSIGEVDSSQFVSALLLIGAHLRDGLTLRYSKPLTSRPYIDMTLDLLRAWGQMPVVLPIDGQASCGGVFFVPPKNVAGRTYQIEPDASSALYFLAAAAMIPDAVCKVEGLSGHSTQPDMHVLEALSEMGAVVERQEASVTVRGPKELRGIEFDASSCPDGAVMLAVLAATAKTPSCISGLQTLKIKESDRITAIVTELNRLGADAQGGPDWIQIKPQRFPETPVLIRTYDDHRMAMAFAVLGLWRGGLSIEDPACVRKSFPEFWTIFEMLIQ